LFGLEICKGLAFVRLGDEVILVIGMGIGSVDFDGVLDIFAGIILDDR
jgi:hypothetical protein